MSVIEVNQSGSTVQASVGDEILVRVPEMPTTGYAWTVTTVDPALRLVESAYVPHDGGVAAGGPGDLIPGGPGDPMPGGGGERVIRLRAAAAGQAMAELALKRPWETAPAERFTLHANVS
jgi:inhibitor of cysteine peptidase